MNTHAELIRWNNIGSSGTGKTELACRAIKTVFAKRRLFIFDHQEEMAERLGIAEQETMEAVGLAVKNNKPVCYNPFQEYQGDVETAFSDFTRYVFEFAQIVGGEKLYYCDEVQNFNNAHGCDVWLKRILQTSRRLEVATLFSFQQANEVSNLLRNQGTHFNFFNHGDDTAMKLPEGFGLTYEELSTLGKGQYIHVIKAPRSVSRGDLFKLTKPARSGKPQDTRQKLPVQTEPIEPTTTE